MSSEARQRRRLDPLALHVADDQRDAIVDADRVIEVAAHIVGTRGREVAAGELQSRQREQRVGQQAALERSEPLRASDDDRGRTERPAGAVCRFVEQSAGRARRARIRRHRATPSASSSLSRGRHSDKGAVDSGAILSRPAPCDRARAMQRARHPTFDLVGDPVRVELTDERVGQLVEKRSRIGASALPVQLRCQLIDALLEVSDPRLVERCDAVVFLQVLPSSRVGY